MDYTQEKFHNPTDNPELAFKTDGDCYYAFSTADDAAETYPAAEFPCYTITTMQLLLEQLMTKIGTGTSDWSTQSTVEGVETTILDDDCRYALVARGHLYLLEEREYDSYPSRDECIGVRTIGYYEYPEEPSE